MTSTIVLIPRARLLDTIIEMNGEGWRLKYAVPMVPSADNPNWMEAVQDAQEWELAALRQRSPWLSLTFERDN